MFHLARVRTHFCRLVLLLVGLFLGVLCFANPQIALADDFDEGQNIAPWHRVYLTNGQTYNVGSASSNTTVYINKPGTYTLTGSSSHMRLVIETGWVDIYLTDGLKIDTGALSYVGSRTAAINVDDMGGTVRLISRPNATITLTGYAGAPAIRKEGTNTRLEFLTEDPMRPGTIHATASLIGGAGIGSLGRQVGPTVVTVGNIHFYSGVVDARGGRNGAGIGGGDHDVLDGLTISGGLIFAQGGGHTPTLSGGAAGIGGGCMGSGKNIVISGGTVTATGGENGAGIGGGMMSSSWGGDGINITISGGMVTATGTWGGAGIGGGWEGNARNITISGGAVVATGGSANGCGIGGGGGQYYGTGQGIVISGGTVIARGGDHGSGIGSTSTGDGETSVTISGGMGNSHRRQ